MLVSGLLTFAACSNDDDQNSYQLPLNDGDMLVTMDDLVYEEDFGQTRSYLSRDLKTHMWVELDSMRVYDNDLHKYDRYKFNWKDDTHDVGVFSRVHVNSFLSTDPKWALFPKNDVHGGHWEQDDKTSVATTFATMMIGTDENGNFRPMKFDVAYQASDAGHANPLFADRLPRWGEVELVDGGQKLKTRLSYLTGVLRLQLANTQGKADLIKVQLFDGTTALPVAGRFNTTLAINDVKQAGASLSADDYEPGSVATELLVDLTGATGSIVVYVPLVTTTVPVDIVASASNDNGQTWTEFKRFKNKTVARGKVYGNANEYAF